MATYRQIMLRHAAVILLWQASDSAENGGNCFPIYESSSAPENDSYYGEGAEYIGAVEPLIKDAVYAFITDNMHLLRLAGVKPQQAGHDFILTANGHGTGFWDRGLGEAGQQLTDATRGYSFDAEFELWGNRADDDQHCADELCWLMVENEVLLDLIGASA